MKTNQLKPSPKLAEQFSYLENRIFSMLNGRSGSPFVLTFASCEPREGVTSIASNFALSLSQDASKQVLLIDGDLRKPSLQNHFRNRLEEKRNETPPRSRNGLPAPAWVVHRENSHLDVLLARRDSENPAAIFQKTRFSEFLERIKKTYDFIVIDCPPLNKVSSSLTIATMSDAVVLVVEAGRVRREVLQRSIITLEDAGANLLGVVLNKRRYPIPGFIYRMI